MSGYLLTPNALSDIKQSLRYCKQSYGRDAALELENELANAFHQLVEYPGLGHRREDLTSKDLHFHLVEPYLIAYRRTVDPLTIVGVLHTARDLRGELQKRR